MRHRIEIAADRMAVRMILEEGAEEALGGDGARILVLLLDGGDELRAHPGYGFRVEARSGQREAEQPEGFLGVLAQGENRDHQIVALRRDRHADGAIAERGL